MFDGLTARVKLVPFPFALDAALKRGYVFGGLTARVKLVSFAVVPPCRPDPCPSGVTVATWWKCLAKLVGVRAGKGSSTSQTDSKGESVCCAFDDRCRGLEPGSPFGRVARV